jgi:hypothetical protein
MLRLRLGRFCSVSTEPFSLLAADHLVQAVEAGAASWGLYGIGNQKTDENWKSLTTNLTARIDPLKTPIETVNSVLSVLGQNNVSIGSFWSSLFAEKIEPKIKSEKQKIPEIIELIKACNNVDFRSDIVIGKLVSLMIENETVWTISPMDLVEVATTVSNSLTQNRQLFSEIGNRVQLELDDFDSDQIISIIEAFAKINFTHEEMLNSAMRRFVDSFHELSLKDKVRISDAISRLRFRSDTFFKTLCAKHTGQLSVDQAAAVAVAMQRLKMNSGSSDWWDRAKDFSALIDIVKTNFIPEKISGMNAKGLVNCVQLVKHNGKIRVSTAVMDRLKFLLTQDPLSRSYRYIAVILEALARGSEAGTVHVDHLRWMAEWLCGYVYILPVHDIAVINRSISKLGFRDHNYHKIWIPYYLERISELTKEDISCISDNFNDIGMSDTQMGGRHFFYKLGQRFQELSVEANGENELNARRKYRNLQRLG